VIVAPAGIVIPVNRQAFQCPVVSQLASGLELIMTAVVATSPASSALAAMAIGPIVVAISNYHLSVANKTFLTAYKKKLIFRHCITL
jgi:hypothetical protein